MDLMLDKILNAAGPLGVLVAVVFMFLRAMQFQSNEHRTFLQSLTNQHQTFLKALTDEHIVAREESRVIIAENTVAMKDNTRALGALSRSVEAKI